MQHLNFGRDKNLKHNLQLDSNTPVALKQGQGHQIWYDLVDPKQGYNNAKFEKNLLEQCL